MSQMVTRPTKDRGGDIRQADSGRILERPVVRQEVFGKLMWKPERARELHQ
ncbi:MAG TPA: hypothetical protein VGJ57_04265 [Nitrospirales bacterium]|jgi:hypothetical protein